MALKLAVDRRLLEAEPQHFHGLDQAFKICKNLFEKGENFQQKRCILSLGEEQLSISTPCLQVYKYLNSQGSNIASTCPQLPFLNYFDTKQF